MSNQKNYKMKRFMYAAMLLLGLSMVSTSCDNSIEGTAKRDAKAYVKALEDGDSKAEAKASKRSLEHAKNYDMNGKTGDCERYKQAYAKYLEMYVDKATK